MPDVQECCLINLKKASATLISVIMAYETPEERGIDDNKQYSASLVRRLNNTGVPSDIVLISISYKSNGSSRKTDYGGIKEAEKAIAADKRVII